ncbi:MAG: hypothetical protein IIA33_10745 [Planctomycetes bacterium]|nr:hypothetical protein [Planctomycetota bacterium]
MIVDLWVGDAELNGIVHHMKNRKVDAVYCDPPWNAGIAKIFRNWAGATGGHFSLPNLVVCTVKQLNTVCPGGPWFLDVGPRPDLWLEAVRRVRPWAVSRPATWGEERRPTYVVQSEASALMPGELHGQESTEWVFNYFVDMGVESVLDPFIGKGLTLRHALPLGISVYGNFMYGWQFSSTSVFLLTPLMTLGYFMVMIIDSEWQLQIPYLGEANLIGAIILVLLMVWIISAIALTVSCKMGQVATLTICVIVLMIGLTSDYLFGQQHLEGIGLLEQPSLLAKLAWIAYRVIPNLGVFWVADAIAMGKNLGPAYMFSALGYAALYIIAILMLGVAVFQKREVG